MPLVTVRHCQSAGQDIQLFYDTFGDRSTGQPLLLVMGLGGQMILWRTEFCERLAEEGFFVIRFDNRDVGLSSHLDHLGSGNLTTVFFEMVLGDSAPPYTVYDMALDAVALLDHLGLPQAHLCGFSMGGLIVQQMAVSFPERVLSLTTMSSPAGLSSSSLRGTIAVMQLSSQDPEENMKKTVKLVKTVSSPKYFNEQQCAASIRECSARSRYMGGVPRQLSAILATDHGIPNVHTVRAPTMVFHGVLDPIVPPESGEILASAISGAQLFMLEEVAHDLPPEIDEILISGLKENAGIVHQRLPEHHAGYEAEGRSEHYDYYGHGYPHESDTQSDQYSAEEDSDQYSDNSSFYADSPRFSEEVYSFPSPPEHFDAHTHHSESTDASSQGHWEPPFAPVPSLGDQGFSIATAGSYSMWSETVSSGSPYFAEDAWRVISV